MNQHIKPPQQQPPMPAAPTTTLSPLHHQTPTAATTHTSSPINHSTITLFTLINNTTIIGLSSKNLFSFFFFFPLLFKKVHIGTSLLCF
jgi:hypothetical protein